MSTPKTKKAPERTTLLRFSTYDSMIGYTRNESDFESYDIWPKNIPPQDVANRVMVVGSSTSAFPRAHWSTVFARSFQKFFGNTVIYNGSCSGYFSSIELQKILRDAPGLKPKLILSFSGAADIGFLHTQPNYPFQHRNATTVGNYLVNTTHAFERLTRGVPVEMQPHELWLQNSRIKHLIAQEYGAQYFSFLEPTMALRQLAPSPAEEAMLKDDAMFRLMPHTGRTYEEETLHFYENVRAALRAEPEKYAHVIDISDVFDGESEVYRDFRHASKKGNVLIGKRIFREVAAAIKKRKLTQFARVDATQANEAEENTAELQQDWKLDHISQKDVPLVLSFSGRLTGERRLSWGHFEFLKSFYGKEYNLFFARDRAHRWYQEGSLGLGDTPQAVADAIATHLAPVARSRSIALGNSMGGYAAILFGLLLKLDKVVAFAPQTFIGAELRKQHHDDRWDDEISAIAHMGYPDLLPLVEATPNTRIAIYFSKDSALDRLHAERLAGCANVSLHWLEGDDHNIARALKNIGMLGEVIDREIKDLPLPENLLQQSSIFSASKDSNILGTVIDEEEC